MRSLLLGLCVLAACGYPKAGPVPGPVTPTAMASAQQRWPDATSTQLEAGHSLFAAKCNGCHDYPDIDSVPDSRWPSTMKKMGKKAKLNDDETEAVLRFIQASRRT